MFVREVKALRVSSLFFCSGAAQVCLDVRVVELKEQLEVEEEDGDRQEEEEKVEKETAFQKTCCEHCTCFL